jgi:hypothetical protein
MRGKQNNPTITSQVLEYLRKVDDMRPSRDICKGIGVYLLPKEEQQSARRAVYTALWWLQKAKCVEAVLVANTPWWFALPEESDNRSRVFQSRVKETVPRKTQSRTVGKKS